MGTVLALVNDSDSTNPAKPVTPVRYLYTPYGEAHAETGPEVLGVKFVAKIDDVPVTSITDLSGATRTQTVADATVAATGMLRVVLSLPADPATLAAVLSVETSTGQGSFSPVATSAYAIGQKPDRPEEIDVLPLSGWNRGAQYRVKLAASLTDKIGRALGSEKSFAWTVPGVGDVAFETSYPVNYETYLAAGESAGGALVGGQPMGWQGAYSDNLTGLQYKRHRFYDPRTLEFLSEDPEGDVDSPNLYAYAANNPVTGLDPEGLRMVDVYIWFKRGTMIGYGRVGHVMMTEHHSQKVLLSQFPQPVVLSWWKWHGINKPEQYYKTFENEGENEDRRFTIFVPNDKNFNHEINLQLTTRDWDWKPGHFWNSTSGNSNETHCARAVYDALKAGGLPVSGYPTGWILPGELSDILEAMIGKSSLADKWWVQKEYVLRTQPEKP